MIDNASLRVDPEFLANWYFRLNGFMTIPNFILHPNERGGSRTEVDVIGVRFPYRCEIPTNPLKDDTYFRNLKEHCIVFAEAATGRCKINKPWRNKDKTNITDLLRAIGYFPKEEVNTIAELLCEKGCYYGENVKVHICSLGCQKDNEVAKSLPEVEQIIWDDVWTFIYHRFSKHKQFKADHQQWDRNAGKLYDRITSFAGVDDLIRSARIEINRKCPVR